MEILIYLTVNKIIIRKILSVYMSIYPSIRLSNHNFLLLFYLLMQVLRSEYEPASQFHRPPMFRVPEGFVLTSRRFPHS
jgi:hypothetical protein